jgi:signal transduction histidine kinase
MRCHYSGEVLIDSDRMTQVIQNILANARDAMPKGGRLTISTKEAKNQVELRFSDTGPGILPDLRGRIFEPFVSHGKKKGAGLGLSIARRIVEEHGGMIDLDSSGERGASFVINLPLHG